MKKKFKQFRNGLWINTIIYLLLAYGTTGSINPIEAVSRANIYIKVPLVFFLFSIPVFILGYLALLILDWTGEYSGFCPVEAEAGITQYPKETMETRGMVKCVRCGRIYHKDCWNGKIRKNSDEPCNFGDQCGDKSRRYIKDSDDALSNQSNDVLY